MIDTEEEYPDLLPIVLSIVDTRTYGNSKSHNKVHMSLSHTSFKVFVFKKTIKMR